MPFDYRFYLDDSALYRLELTENAFRSQGMALSEPVKIGDWDHLTRYPLTASAIPYGTALVLERPITLDQPVYLPGNDAMACGVRPCFRRSSARTPVPTGTRPLHKMAA